MNKSLLNIISIGLVVISTYSKAQVNSGKGTYTFPQNKKYMYGIKPSNANSKDATKSYDDWMTEFLIPSKTVPQLYGVNYGGDVTVSEGIGYGMLLSAYANDSVTFNGLWRFYKKYKDANGLMNWRIGINNLPTPDKSGNCTGCGGAT